MLAFSHFVTQYKASQLKLALNSTDLQNNRLVQAPFWMDGKMPPVGLVRLREHGTLVNGGIIGYPVNWKMVPSLELLPHVDWQALPGFLVIRLFGDIWSPPGIVE